MRQVLKESRAYYVDARQNDIGLMVDAMRSRAHRRKDSSILSPFETVLVYHGQIGDKAALSIVHATQRLPPRAPRASALNSS